MIRQHVELDVEIGRLFSFTFCAIGLSLIGVFVAKLISSSLQVALTDYLLLSIGFAVACLGLKFSFSDYIFAEGGRKRVDVLFFKLGLALSFLLVTGKVFAGGSGSYVRSLEEGGIVEWASFLLMLASSYMFFRCSRIIRPVFLRSIYRFLSVLSFVVGMEEMSWGQMLFRWKTPGQLSLINSQGETNLHNIQLIHGHADLAYGVMLLLVIMLSLSSGRLASLNQKSLFFDSLAKLAPSRYLLVYFLPASILILCLYFDVHEYTNGFTFKGEEEVAEMLGAIGLFAYSISQTSLFWRLSRSC